MLQNVVETSFTGMNIFCGFANFRVFLCDFGPPPHEIDVNPLRKKWGWRVEVVASCWKVHWDSLFRTRSYAQGVSQKLTLFPLPLFIYTHQWKTAGINGAALNCMTKGRNEAHRCRARTAVVTMAWILVVLSIGFCYPRKTCSLGKIEQQVVSSL